jgi:hypothetical protein
VTTRTPPAPPGRRPLDIFTELGSPDADAVRAKLRDSKP